MINIFEQIKSRVTARQAAEYYGLKVERNGMACCPFHDDKHPSMKIDQNYYCQLKSKRRVKEECHNQSRTGKNWKMHR